jgi:CHAT domain-containing protein
MQTAHEIDRLRSFFPGAQVVRDMDELFRLLTTGGFGMLHFASHNNLQPDDAGVSFVPFENARFDLMFMGNVAKKKYASTTPLVFMNACTSAGKAPLFTDVSSWADRYLYSGAGAFVGSLWEVRDQSAPEFAAAFYQKLTSGGTLGEAVKAGREIIKANNPGDPTRLAYTLYGNPLATLQL